MTTIRYKTTRPGLKILPPAYMTEGASGMDLCAIEFRTIHPGETFRFQVGFAIELPPGSEGQIRPRSGLSAKGVMCHLGTIDSDYRGELAVVLSNVGSESYTVNAGDRIAQLVIGPVYRFHLELTDELSDTVRGAGGFGHTGR